MAYHSLRIAQVLQETHDARSFVLAVPAELKDRFGYRAGQFLTFRVPFEGATLLRCYSLSSSPETGDPHKVTVKRVDDGRVSNWFHDTLEAGHVLEVLEPAGRFVLRGEDEPLLLFAGGSGITPVISIVKTALATTRRRLRLFYANRDERSIIFAAELEALRAAHPDRLEVRHHLDAESGFASAAQLRESVRGFEAAHCYICGPGPFMELAESVLLELGVAKERLHIERFESPADGELPEVARSADTTGLALGGADLPSEIIVHLDGVEHRVPYQAGQSILEAARGAGLEAPFACEEGYCGSCAAKRLQGTVEMATNDVFDPEEIEDGWILTCQGRPKGAVCEIRYDD